MRRVVISRALAPLFTLVVVSCHSEHESSVSKDPDHDSEKSAVLISPNGILTLVEDQGHGLPGCYRCGLDTADFDRDGRIDIVIAGSFGPAFTAGMDSYTNQNAVRIYRNISTAGGAIRFSL